MHAPACVHTQHVHMVLPSFKEKEYQLMNWKHGVVKTVNKAKRSVMSTYWGISSQESEYTQENGAQARRTRTKWNSLRKCIKNESFQILPLVGLKTAQRVSEKTGDCYCLYTIILVSVSKQNYVTLTPVPLWQERGMAWTNIYGAGT